jgi:hypothetical protein
MNLFLRRAFRMSEKHLLRNSMDFYCLFCNGKRTQYAQILTKSLKKNCQNAVCHAKRTIFSPQCALAITDMRFAPEKFPGLCKSK